MKAEDITDEFLDNLVIEIFENKESRYKIIRMFVSTNDMAKKLWSKHRIPYKRDVDIIRKKMKSWWANKPWIYEPRPHKKIGNYAVHISSPMGPVYCILEGGLTGKALISFYPNQREFQTSIASDILRSKEEV